MGQIYLLDNPLLREPLTLEHDCLLSVADHCLRSRGYVNVIVAGKQPALDYLTIDQAVAHCTRGLGIWDWAGNDQGGEPDVVMACAGDIPTLETLAAAALLREQLPHLRVRVINVVDLMRLEPDSEHPHGLSDPEFDALFTTDRPVIAGGPERAARPTTCGYWSSTPARAASSSASSTMIGCAAPVELPVAPGVEIDADACRLGSGIARSRGRDRASYRSRRGGFTAAR